MIYVFVLSASLTLAVFCWFVQRWLLYRYASYQKTFKRQASQGMSEMFLFLDPGQVWSASLGTSAVVAVFAYALTGGWLMPAVIAGALLLTPQYILVGLRRRRLQRIDQQLPDFLLALAGALRAGSGVQSALRHIADYMPVPLSQELHLMLREQRMGVDFETALSGFHKRMPTEGASLVVSSLRIAAQSGGSLAETLERIAVTLRTRLHLFGRVRALTSQGRMQALVMAALPAGLAVVLHWLDPEAMSPLWSTPGGWSVLALVVVLEACGIFFIRRIVTIVI